LYQEAADAIEQQARENAELRERVVEECLRRIDVIVAGWQGLPWQAGQFLAREIRALAKPASPSPQEPQRNDAESGK
jgi:hypothetical protein